MKRALAFVLTMCLCFVGAFGLAACGSVPSGGTGTAGGLPSAETPSSGTSGSNAEEDGGMCGDVDVESISHKASLATPVPGGVGAVTTSVLASHVLRAAMARRGMSPEDTRREE